MRVDNVDYNAVFGVEAGTDAGENDQQAAEADESAETEETEEVEETEEEEAEGEEGSAGEGKPGQKTGQSAEENSKYAAARRKAEAERDAAVQKAVADAKAQMQAEMEETIKALGMVNPYTKQPIATKKDLDDYKQQFEIEKKAKFAKRAGMNDKEFQAFVNDLPEVKEAKAKAEQAEAAQRQVQEEKARAEIDRQIGEIRELDPSIGSLEDLTKMPNYREFYDKVKRGYTLTDAFRLVNAGRLQEQDRETAKQAALNNVASKSHLDRTTTRGAGVVTVPADVMAQYRMFDPDATDEEIRKHWAKYSAKSKN